jgi:hypothetical protein
LVTNWVRASIACRHLLPDTVSIIGP